MTSREKAQLQHACKPAEKPKRSFDVRHLTIVEKPKANYCALRTGSRYSRAFNEIGSEKERRKYVCGVYVTDHNTILGDIAQWLCDRWLDTTVKSRVSPKCNYEANVDP